MFDAHPHILDTSAHMSMHMPIHMCVHMSVHMSVHMCKLINVFTDMHIHILCTPVCNTHLFYLMSVHILTHACLQACRYTRPCTYPCTCPNTDDDIDAGGDYRP